MRTSLIAYQTIFRTHSPSNQQEEQNKELATKLSDSLFTLVKLQPQVRVMENKLSDNPTFAEIQMDYVDTARVGLILKK